MVIRYEDLDKRARRLTLVSVGLIVAIWLLAGYLIALVLTKLFLRVLGYSAGMPPGLMAIVFLFYLIMGGASLSYYSAKTFLRLWLRLFASETPRGDPRVYARVSIIIPSYNEERYIGRTLQALLSQNYPSDLMEVIVVDDGSSDATPLIVERYSKQYPQIRVIRHKSNLGKARAIASGVAASRGDVIILLDADTVPDRNAVRRLVARIVTSNNVGAVSGAIMPAGGHGLLYWLQRLEYFLAYQVGKFFDEVTGGVNMIIPGAFSAFRARMLRSFFLSLHDRLDETVAEDFDLTIRVWKKGLRTGYEEDASAYTSIPHSLRELYVQRIRWFSGGLQVVLKHLGLFTRGKRHTARERSRRVTFHILLAEYLLALLQVAGYLSVVVILVLQAIGMNVLALSPIVLVSILLASYVASVVMGVLNIEIAYGALYGAKNALYVLPYALIYTTFYLPLLAIAKSDAFIRVAKRVAVKWR